MGQVLESTVELRHVCWSPTPRPQRFHWSREQPLAQCFQRYPHVSRPPLCPLARLQMADHLWAPNSQKADPKQGLSNTGFGGAAGTAVWGPAVWDAPPGRPRKFTPRLLGVDGRSRHDSWESWGWTAGRGGTTFPYRPREGPALWQRHFSQGRGGRRRRREGSSLRAGTGRPAPPTSAPAPPRAQRISGVRRVPEGPGLRAPRAAAAQGSLPPLARRAPGGGRAPRSASPGSGLAAAGPAFRSGRSVRPGSGFRVPSLECGD